MCPDGDASCPRRCCRVFTVSTLKTVEDEIVRERERESVCERDRERLSLFHFLGGQMNCVQMAMILARGGAAEFSPIQH